MGTCVASSRAVARVLVACAVLVGLFLMHGLATLGCGGQVGTPPPSTTLPAMPGLPMGTPATGGPAHTQSMIDHAADASPTAGTHAHEQGSGMAGGVCVSTPPRSVLTGLLALLLAVGAVLLGSVMNRHDPITRLPRGQSRRAPPPSGAVLLTNLSISRT